MILPSLRGPRAETHSQLAYLLMGQQNAAWPLLNGTSRGRSLGVLASEGRLATHAALARDAVLATEAINAIKAVRVTRASIAIDASLARLAC